MDDREYSKLNYLTAAIAANPSKAKKFIELCWRKELIPPSPEFVIAIQGLQIACDKHKGNVKAAAIELLNSQRPSEKAAGRALTNAYRNGGT